LSEEALIERLDELIFWTRLSAMPTIRKTIVDNLRSDIDKLVYHFSDGNASTREIASIITRGGRRVTHVTVSNMWRKWAILNMVMPAQRRGRYRRIVSLESLGIEIPQLEVSSDEE
jgi:hypothetical protein